jgi:regulator of PEP synthase PpsR (kinase-PPPase family)
LNTGSGKPEPKVQTQLFAFVVEQDEVAQVVKLAREKGALVVFTFASAELRCSAASFCSLAEVDFVDLVGPTMRSLSKFLGRDAIGQGSNQIAKPLDEEYFRRIEAVEFTMRQDDGALPANLHKADVVVVAPSRCGKTPLTMYLAQEHHLR